eukprot:TRINITY_DN10400_c0_g1_i1.p1 TRINITY_DN10400_c0_g1~~TRINITY_DN10400_c0_g1_i1.p1  ORF type:complete len:450 (+),score=21.63 TRINITY_DN10400_c0_g1_i1:84-1433(+)
MDKVCEALPQELHLFLQLHEYMQTRSVCRDWCQIVDRCMPELCSSLLPHVFFGTSPPMESRDLLRVLHSPHASTRWIAHDVRLADANVCATSPPSATSSGYIIICGFTFGVIRISITSEDTPAGYTCELTAECPISFMNATAALLSDETLVVFGGELPCIPDSTTSAVYTLNVSEMPRPRGAVWRGPLRLSELHTSRPAARVNSAVCVTDDRMFFFGGAWSSEFLSERSTTYDDMWTLDLHDDAAVWRHVEFGQCSRPSGREKAAMTMLPYTDRRGHKAYRIILHGGIGVDNDLLSDLWLIELEKTDVHAADVSDLPPHLRVVRAVEIYQIVHIPRWGHTLHVFGRLAVLVGGSGESERNCYSMSAEIVTCIMHPAFDSQVSQWQMADVDGIAVETEFALVLNSGRTFVVGGECCITSGGRDYSGNLFEVTLLNDNSRRTEAQTSLCAL